MPYIDPNEWVPVGVEEMEPFALHALRHAGNTCVTAGPGAGKTEFLAQRATYLLQTGICPPPYRILAISFKSDAADNLAKRVQLRCPPEQAARFVSLTFDAFTKNLVDRFRTAIPNDWRPTHPYNIITPRDRDIQRVLQHALRHAPDKWKSDIRKIPSQWFESRMIGSYKLPLSPPDPSSAKEFAIYYWWVWHLRKNTTPDLSFVMLNRLAEILLRSSLQLLRALRRTYAFVFVDEFQDTTYAQYDFLHAAFANSKTKITAVGDNKQAIMRWAGARPDAFQRFQSDFQSESFQLLANYRSSPGLVSIQHIIARALDRGVAEAVSRVQQAIDADVAQIWTHHSTGAESAHIASWLANDMQEREKHPRDYVVLVRQQADRFEEQLTKSFTSIGLRLRNENRRVGPISLQDLFAEPLTQIGIDVLRLAVHRRNPSCWERASLAHLHLRAIEVHDTSACQAADKQLRSFIRQLRKMMNTAGPCEDKAREITTQLFEFLDPIAIAHTYLAYRKGDMLEFTIQSFREHLSQSTAASNDWEACLDVFEGVNQVPLMTIHKSKGLEFDTVIFVGMDDKEWWSYTADNPEGLATFFVAISRAKQRSIFSYCQARGEREKIRDLYTLLSEASVPEITFNN